MAFAEIRTADGAVVTIEVPDDSPLAGLCFSEDIVDHDLCYDCNKIVSRCSDCSDLQNEKAECPHDGPHSVGEFYVQYCDDCGEKVR